MPTDGERICMADQRKKKPKKTKASLILFIVELVVLVVLVGAIFGYAKINEGLRNIGTANFGNASAVNDTAGNATVGNATAGNAAAANAVTANTGNIVADSASASVEGVMLANASATGEVVVDELIEETVEDESVKKKNSESDEKASRSGKTSSGSDKKASESDKKSSEADEKTTKKKTSENAVATGSKTLKGETVTHVGTDEDPNADADAAEENEGISRNEKMKGYTNVVLVGIDTRDVDQIDYANSDTMIIASINNDTGNVRMVSVYRDTLLNVQDDYSMSLSQGDLDEEPASYAEAEVIGETTAYEEPAYDDEYEPIDDSYDDGGYDDGGYDDGGYDDGGYDDGGYDDGGYDDGGYDDGGYDDGGYDDGGYDDGGYDDGGYDDGGNDDGGDNGYDDGGNDDGGYNDGGDNGYDPVDDGGSTGDDGSHTDDDSTGGDAGNETADETGDNGNASVEDDVAPLEENEADSVSEEDKEDKEDTEDKDDNEDRDNDYVFEEPDDDVSEYADNEYYNYSETGTVATSQLGETTAAGRYDKANSAYANGSTKQLLQMLNKNMDLNIHDIIVVDFSSVAKLVDDLGGIDVWMTFEEVTHMNNYCQETSKVTGLDYTPIEPEEMPREYHLNGVQAVSYARIRYTAGNDMKRTQRQRVVIQKVVEKAKKNGLDAVQGMINDVLPMCKTSFSIAEIIKLARQAFSFDIEKTAGFPFEHIEKTVYVGSKALDAVVPVTLETNVQELHEFLFDDEDYECSATVKEYSNDISVLSGLTEASRDVAVKNSVIGESGGEADVVI